MRQRVVLEGAAVAYYHAGRRPETVRCLAEALRSADSADPGLLQSLVRVELELGRHGDALARLDASPELVAREPVLLALRGVAHEARGDSSAARGDYEAAFAGGLEHAGVDARFASLLSATGDEQAALAHVERRLATAPTPLLRLIRGRLLRSTGDLDRSLAELEALAREGSGGPDALYELVETHHARKAHTAALEVVDRILAVGATPLAHYLRARSQVELGWFKESQASLEAALALDASLQPAHQLLEHVQAMLGEGSNEVVRQEIAPLEIPAGAERLLQAPGEPEGAREHGAFLHYHVTGIRWTPGEEIRSTTRWKAQVLDVKGVDSLGSLQLEFDPLGEEIHVNALIVRDDTGREVSRGRVEDSYVLDVPAEVAVTQRKLLNLPVRGLAPGMSVELVVTRRERPPRDRFRYRAQVFSQSLPVGRSALFVTGPVGELVSESTAGVQTLREGQRIEWWVDQPPAYRWEPLQPPAASYLPQVRVADRRETWQGVARAYLDEIGDRLRLAPELAAVAEEITRDLTNADEKARALARHVQRQLTYRAVAFGPRARIPSRIGEILDRRYGDCKDHALLLHQLLAVAGVQSHLALASLGAEPDGRLASLDAFDHMIVRCEGCTKAVFLDATDKGLAPGIDVPRGLAGKQVLVLDAERPRLERVPEPDPALHVASSDRTVRVQADGAVEIEEQVRLSGYAGALVRDLFHSYDRSLWSEVMRRTLGGADIRVQDLQVGALDEAERPLDLTIAYTVERAFSRSTTGLVGHLPSAFEDALLRLDGAAERATPFEIAIPLRFETRARLLPPAGFAVVSAARVADPREGGFARWKGSIGAATDGMELGFDFAGRAGRFAAGEFAPYQAEVRDALDFLRSPIELGGASSAERQATTSTP
jgi:transglutaminase-like putative cysteine protease/tetratricopeptide (TPR) repeat protein